ncbi:YlbF family regulator [Dehalobacterium formicoaceticum]|uniref:YlbF family regulator n=1 Tax=Dehalobacterium formicoaceticum TaxID=51515 RepID=UPI000B7EE8FE|nr:YlbF family regulator [Dehalobacterium formicoaceticum]
MEVLNKAQELANALENSEELLQMREAEKRMNEDQTAMSLMHEFRNKQMEVYNVQVAGQEPSKELEQEMENLRAKLQENPLILDYITAQEKLGRVLEYINRAISQVLQGESSCDESSCSSCAGCN